MVSQSKRIILLDRIWTCSIDSGISLWTAAYINDDGNHGVAVQKLF